MSVRALIVALAAVALTTGCAHYAGGGRRFDPAELSEPGWIRVTGMREVRQDGASDCGPAAVAMVLARWQRPVALAALRGQIPVPEGGLKASDLRTLLRAHGLRAFVVEGAMADLEHELAAGRPVIVGTVKPVDRRTVLHHFEVVVALHAASGRVVTLDPSGGWRELSVDEFAKQWAASGHTAVVALP